MISKSDIQFPEIGGNARKVSALPCLLIRVASYPLIFLLVIGICTSPCFGQSNDKVPRVTVVNPVQKTLVYRLPAKPAEILAAQEAVLYARTSGYLDQISVDIGDQVEKGQIVATLDTPELTDELNRAEARLLESTASLNAAKAQADGGNAHLVAARAAHRQAQAETLQEVGQQQKAEVELNAQKVQTVRIRRLHQQDAATEAQLEVAERDLSHATHEVEIRKSAVQAAKTMEGVAEAKITVAEAELTAKASLVSVAEAGIGVANAQVGHAKTMLGYANIKAPFAGVITERYLDLGAAVVTASSSKNTAIVAIKDLSSMRIFVQIPEPDVPYVQKGHPAEVTCSAYPNRKFQGVVSRISRNLDRRTRTMKAEILLDNKDGKIYPGMFATVNFDLIERKDAWTLPAQALLGSKGDYHVYCVVDGVCRVVPIKIGLDDGGTVEIIAGMSGNEKVILVGKGLVQEGDRVEAVGSNP
ncbi:MAG: efflux RND transporter periplasmic adaptor subunit [Planctomycetota bacterium]|nr:efflux RND transporter periplasmic adaptor subunit [Planctomycetota bacterium]